LGIKIGHQMAEKDFMDKNRDSVPVMETCFEVMKSSDHNKFNDIQVINSPIF
jgi:hypothetical protein